MSDVGKVGLRSTEWLACVCLVVVDVPGLRHLRQSSLETGQMAPPRSRNLQSRADGEIGWIGTGIIRLAAEAAGRRHLNVLAHSAPQKRQAITRSPKSTTPRSGQKAVVSWDANDASWRRFRRRENCRNRHLLDASVSDSRRNQAQCGSCDCEGFTAVETTDGARNEENEPDIRYRWRA